MDLRTDPLIVIEEWRVRKDTGELFEQDPMRFLDATTHLYKRVCPSIRPFDRRSVRHGFSSMAEKSRFLGERCPVVASGAEYSALFKKK